jgi:hypothetical protein
MRAIRGFRPDHRAGIELAAVDAHRAAETAADLEGGFDDRVAREARRDRSEIGDFPGRGRASPPAPPRRGAVYRALGWSSADYIQIHCGALCAD